MKIGCHISIAGGIDKSVERATKLGINSMQIFSKNSLSWQGRNYSDEEIDAFQKNLVRTGIKPVFIHASYLINLASPDKIIYHKSMNALWDEIKRADLLLPNSYQPYLIVHPGTHRGSGEVSGLRRIIHSLNAVLDRSDVQKVKTVILLENVSGSGTSLGATFTQLRDMMEGVNRKEKVGLCMDTCHAFAAGYDVSHENGVEVALTEIDRLVGLKRLKVIHLNDSRYPLGSRRDRHMHIGRGFIGKRGISSLINHPSLKNIPLILVTPKENEDDDQRNISLVRQMSQKDVS